MTSSGVDSTTVQHVGLPQLIVSSLRTLKAAYLVPVTFALLVVAGHVTSNYVTLFGLVVLYLVLLPYTYWVRGGDVRVDEWFYMRIVLSSLVAFFVLLQLLGFVVNGLEAVIFGESISELWMMFAGMFLLAATTFIVARVILFFPAFMIGGNPIEAVRYTYRRPIPDTVVIGAYYLFALVASVLTEFSIHLVAPFPVGRLAALVVFSTLATIGSAVAYERFDRDAENIFVQ